MVLHLKDGREINLSLVVVVICAVLIIIITSYYLYVRESAQFLTPTNIEQGKYYKISNPKILDTYFYNEPMWENKSADYYYYAPCSLDIEGDKYYTYAQLTYKQIDKGQSDKIEITGVKIVNNDRAYKEFHTWCSTHDISKEYTLEYGIGGFKYIQN